MNKDVEHSYVKRVDASRADIWKKLQTKLNHIDIELTERCNNRCVHCYINLPENDRQARSKELTSDEIKDVLKQAAALGCMRVRFTGGEPMLRPDFAALYQYSKRLGMKVVVFTNATLIDQSITALFKKYPPGAPVEISVYGMTRDSYEAVSRLPGSFEAAFRGIQLLWDNGIPFVVKSAFLPQNKDDIEKFEKWAATIPWMAGQNPGYSHDFDLRTRRDSEQLNERIKKLRMPAEEQVAFLSRDAEAYIKDMRQFCASFTSPPGDKLFSCGAGKKSATIDAYGNVQVCLLVRHPDTVYNLRHGSLEEAIDRFFPKVLATKAKNKDYLETCAKCFLKGMCQQCPGRSWSEFGELDRRVPYFCKATHAQARWLGLLDENEMAWEVVDWQERLAKFSNQQDEKQNQQRKE